MGSQISDFSAKINSPRGLKYMSGVFYIFIPVVFNKKNQ